MKFLYGLSGAGVPVIRDFEIDSKAEIYTGEVVTLTDGGVIGKGCNGLVLGVAAEDHTGKNDILNERNNAGKLRVDITKDGVYSVPASKLTVSKKGTGTSIVCPFDMEGANLAGAKLILTAKGENSENTDSVGTERKIGSVSYSDGVATFTVNDGGISCTGDVYALIPPYGYKGSVADDCKSFSCNSAGGITLTVAGYDKMNATLEVILGKRYFD